MSQEEPIDLFTSFQDPESPDNQIVFEDDGNVAYAYFYKNEKITGFTWLYNRPGGLLNDWANPRDPEEPPTNSEDCFSASDIVPIEDLSEVDVHWLTWQDARQAGIYFRNRLYAVVVDGITPGWCIAATKGSPVAGPLVSNDWEEIRRSS